MAETQGPPKIAREADKSSDGLPMLSFLAKKTVAGVVSIFEGTLAATATAGDLASSISGHEGCEASSITLVCRGKILQAAAPLQPLADNEQDSKISVVYVVRKPAAAAAAPAAVAPATSSASSGQPTAGSNAAVSAAAPEPSKVAADTPGRRVLLLMRHGQCCHNDEGKDELKALTVHGQQQAESSAVYVAQLFEGGKVPGQRAMLHSTSRRARETAAKLPAKLPGLEVWNADLLRETDPTANPLRAEECFIRLFDTPPAGNSDTLIIVAHNNIILYLLMRSAGVPIERAAQAWRLFHLRHASVTRIEVTASGLKQVISIGAAGHIPHAIATWDNLAGADMAAWKGGGPERRKFSGRMVVLVRLAAANSDISSRQMKSLAECIKGFSEYMVSGRMSVTSTVNAAQTADAIAQEFKARLNIFPDSITEHPEGAFLQFFCPPGEHSRDTVVMVGEDGPILYWLLRALQMAPDEAKLAASSYCIGNASITLVNIRSNGSTKVVTVGDTGHLPIDCT